MAPELEAPGSGPVPAGAQLLSDLHRAFVQLQEGLCRLAQDDAAVLLDQPAALRSLALQALVHYRNAVHAAGQRPAGSHWQQVHAAMHLLELCQLRKGTRLDAMLEDWLTESFPVAADDALWPLFFRSVVRRRFDQACLLLHGQAGLPSDQVQALTELMLAFPTPRQRAANAAAVDAWRGDVRSRLRVENLTAWHPQLAAAMQCLAGGLPAAVAAHLATWQELYAARLLMGVPADARACAAERPSGAPALDALSLAVLEGAPAAQLADHARPIAVVGPHLVDLLGCLAGRPAGGPFLEYAELVVAGCPALWNLAADYLWVGGPEGQRRLEQLLFGLARSTSDPAKLQAIGDVCRNFDLDVLADAIHLLSAEALLEAGDLRGALFAAVQAGQDALVTRICDQALRRFYATRDAHALDLVVEDALDVAAYPRLHLLVLVRRMHTHLGQEDYQAAAAVLADDILASQLFVVPEFLQPRLLEAFADISSRLPAPPFSHVLKALLELMTSQTELGDAEADRVRLLINRQACLSFSAQF